MAPAISSSRINHRFPGGTSILPWRSGSLPARVRLSCSCILPGADPCLLAGYEPRRDEPPPQGKMGTLYHRLRAHAELVRAGRGAADRADEPLRELLLDKPSLTGLTRLRTSPEAPSRFPCSHIPSCSAHLHAPWPCLPPIFRMHQPFIHGIQLKTDRNC